jgi:hypothetical protein
VYRERSLGVVLGRVLPVTQLVELAATGIGQALDGRELTKWELGVELGKRMPPQLRPWFEHGTFYGANLDRVVSLQGPLLLRAPFWKGGLLRPYRPVAGPSAARTR